MPSTPLATTPNSPRGKKKEKKKLADGRRESSKASKRGNGREAVAVNDSNGGKSVIDVDGMSASSMDTGMSGSSVDANIRLDDNSSHSLSSTAPADGSERFRASPPNNQTSMSSKADGQRQKFKIKQSLDTSTTDTKHEGVPANALSVDSVPGLQSESVRQPAGEVIDDVRRQRIIENIKHRRTLLSWLRESRVASESRISQMAKEGRKIFMTSAMDDDANELGNNSSQEQTNQLLSGGLSNAEMHREIEEYNKVASMAGSSSVLKKPREIKRVSISGKRPSSALPTSTSIEENSTDNLNTISGKSTEPSHQSSASSLKISLEKISSAVSVKDEQASSIKSSYVNPDNVTSMNESFPIAAASAPNSFSATPPIQATPVLSSQLVPQLTQSLNVTAPPAVQTANALEAPSMISKAPLDKHQKKLKKKANSLKKMGSLGDDGIISLSLPQTQQNATSTLAPKTNPTNRILKSLTLSSKASKLMKKRNLLALKLNNMLRKQRPDKGNAGTTSVAQMTRLANSSKRTKLDIHPQSAFVHYRQSKKRPYFGNASQPSQHVFSDCKVPLAPFEPKQPPRLPPRRKTQWDFVLEEMKWMATDFIEERKWKQACGKMLSRAVQIQTREIKNVSSRKVASVLTTPSPVKQDPKLPNGAERVRPIVNIPSPKKSTASLHPDTNDAIDSNVKSVSSDETNNLFVKPSKADVENTRKISRLLSIAVVEHWDTTLNEGAFPTCDGSLNVGSVRLKKLRNAVLSAGQSELDLGCSSMSSSAESSSISSHDSDGCTSSGADATKQETEDCSKPELTYDEISLKVEQCINLFSSKKDETKSRLEKERVLQKYKDNLKCGAELSHVQIHAVHFIENVWQSNSDREGTRLQNPSISGLLGGRLGRGKTVAACSLLWKNRLSGPQLIVCSPCELMRWKHELNRFNDLDVHIFGCGGWSLDCERTQKTKYNACDVVVCDYGSFLEIVSCSFDSDDDGKSKRQWNANALNFASLVLDVRQSHPPASYKKSKRIYEQKCYAEAKRDFEPRTETESLQWWNILLNFVMKVSDMRRLIIEHSDLPHNRFCPKQFDSNVRENDLDEILAMKVAFMYHPTTFFSKQIALGRRILLWARCQGSSKVELGKRRNLLCTQQLLDSDIVPASCPRHRLVLAASLCSVSDCVEDLINTTHNVEHDLSYAWEIRMCSMAEKQQTAYTECCSKNKDSLSQSYQPLAENSSDICNPSNEVALLEISSVLLKLRKVCIHSHLDDLIQLILPSFERKLSTRVYGLGNPRSEPCVEDAMRVVEKSSKMKELLRVLIEDCGYNVPSGNELMKSEKSGIDLLSNKIPSVMAGRLHKAKVLILATLIEAQILTSFFLSAIGLHHEVLISGSRHFRGRTSSDIYPFLPSDSDSSNHSNYDTRLNSLPAKENSTAWAWSQNVLSQFNAEMRKEDEPTSFRYCGIVVSSPKAVSSHNGGIGASSADVVISIDEDWSGREALHITSILTRIRCRESGTGAAPCISPCKFIKLVCENTCEDSFLCRGNTMKLSEKVKVEGTMPVGKRETRKRGKAGTRRSPRGDQNSPPSKESQEASDSIKLNQNSFCSANFNLDGVQVDSGGFLLPLRFKGDLTKSPLISNIVRYKNNELSSVFCTAVEFSSMSSSGSLFMPSIRDHCQEPVNPEDIANDGFVPHGSNWDTLFAWAMINSEKEASYFTTSRQPTAGNLSKYFGDLVLQPISPFPMFAPFSSTYLVKATLRDDSFSAPTRCYIEAFCQQTVVSSNESVKKQVDNEKKSTLEACTSSTSANAAFELDKSDVGSAESSLTDINHKSTANIAPIDCAASFLMYTLPLSSQTSAIGKIRKSAEFEFVHHQKQGLYNGTLSQGNSNTFSSSFNPCEEFAQDAFAMCFSYSNEATTLFLRDGNVGCEPLIYFPSFFTSLIQTVQSLMRSPNSILSQGNAAPLSAERKEIEETSSNGDTSRSRISVSPDESVSVSDFDFDVPLDSSQLLESAPSAADFEVSNSFFPLIQPNDCKSNVVPSCQDYFEFPDQCQNEFSCCNIETNPYSFLQNQNDLSNVELQFTKALLAFDMRGVRLNQSWPFTNSMVLITQTMPQPKPLGSDNSTKDNLVNSSSLSSSALAVPALNAFQNNSRSFNIKPDSSEKKAIYCGKKAFSKKGKKRHKSVSLLDRLTSPYFKKDFLRARAYAARNGIKGNFAASVFGLVRLRFRLNDFVSDSFVLMDNFTKEFPESSESSSRIPNQALHVTRVDQTSYDPLASSLQLNYRPSQSKHMPIIGDFRVSRKRKSLSGISLPMGVKTPRLAKKFSSSLEETSEPWTDVQDSILKESVAQYGCNWQLAARAVSNSKLSAPFTNEVLHEFPEINRTVNPRRSPAQCRCRWESFQSSSVLLTTEKKSPSVTDASGHVGTEIPWFENDQMDENRESLILKSSLHGLRGKHLFQWDGRSISCPESDNLSRKDQRVAKRISQLRKTSRKRRTISITIPGSNAAGNDTTLVPIHPSHAESVQAARMSLSSPANGFTLPRPEMWPLEFLDYTSKLRTSTSTTNIVKTQREVPRAVAPPPPSHQPLPHKPPSHQPPPHKPPSQQPPPHKPPTQPPPPQKPTSHQPPSHQPPPHQPSSHPPPSRQPPHHQLPHHQPPHHQPPPHQPPPHQPPSHQPPPHQPPSHQPPPHQPPPHQPPSHTSTLPPPSHPSRQQNSISYQPHGIPSTVQSTQRHEFQNAAQQGPSNFQGQPQHFQPGHPMPHPSMYRGGQARLRHPPEEKPNFNHRAS